MSTDSPPVAARHVFAETWIPHKVSTRTASAAMLPGLLSQRGGRVSSSSSVRQLVFAPPAPDDDDDDSDLCLEAKTPGRQRLPNPHRYGPLDDIPPPPLPLLDALDIPPPPPLYDESPAESPEVAIGPPPLPTMQSPPPPPQEAWDVPPPPLPLTVSPAIPPPPEYEAPPSPADPKVQKMLAKRRAIAREILETERTYLHQLNVLTTVFLGQMRVLKFDRAILFALFSNAEVIRNCHDKLFAKLKERVGSWADNSIIGDIFLNDAQFIKLYKYYINNFGNATDTMVRLKKSDQYFRRFLQEMEKRQDLGGLDLGSILVVPVQRIPRYVLLLQDMVKSTPAGHPDVKLPDALAFVKELADYINERKRESENQALLRGVQNRIKRFDGDLTLMPNRVFQKEWDVVVNKERAHMFVFSDVLIITKPEKKGLFSFKKLLQLKTTALHREDAMTYRLLSPEGVALCSCSAEADADVQARLVEECIDKSRSSMIRSAFVDETSLASEGSAVFQEKQEEQMQAQRKDAMHKLVSSERTYISSVQHTYDSFLQPMKEMKCMHNAVGNVDLCVEYEKLIQVHHSLLVELEELERDWSHNSSLGALFLEKEPSLRFYGHYISGHSGLLQHLNKTIGSNQMLALFIREKEAKQREDVKTLLEKPLGRVAEYFLRLQEILEYTTQKHPDRRDLERAVEAIRILSDNIAKKGNISKSNSMLGHSSSPLPKKR